VLIIQVGQSLVLIVGLRVLLSDGGFTVFGPTPDNLMNLIIAGALLWILVKIPSWVMQRVQLGGGRSFLGSLVRGFIAYKTFGLRPVGPQPSGTTGRPRRHGGEFAFGDPATWGDPEVTIETMTRLYGPALIWAWERLRLRLTHRIAWAGHDGTLPILEGTVIRLQVEWLPSSATPKPVWLWHSRTGLDYTEVDLAQQGPETVHPIKVGMG
jgi:hypothetical protein